MLLFIQEKKIFRGTHRNFKTSHVIVYLYLLMHLDIFYEFQNISCYCLSEICGERLSNMCISKHLMLLFIPKVTLVLFLLRYFKTSHVIVYHNAAKKSDALRGFQNISCYCLSTLLTYKSICKSSFQNISCYCLSSSRFR